MSELRHGNNEHSPDPSLDEHLRELQVQLPMADRTEITEVATLNLPNLEETVITSKLLKAELLPEYKPLHVRLPLPGRYANRPGERIANTELLPLVHQWLDGSKVGPRFVVQGGNRYISEYLGAIDVSTTDIKVMSIDKAPLSTSILTVLSATERQASVTDE
jgi:hypothetical protein